MEPVPQTYVSNQQILDTELNDLCKRAAGFAPANQNNYIANGATVTPDGSTEVAWLLGISADNVATWNFVVVDDSIDWRDRIVVADYVPLTSNARYPGQADDYLFDFALTRRCGYTGTGGRDAGNATPTAGHPPVPATAASWAVQVVTNLWLYAQPSTGELALYNNTGSTITVPTLFVRCTAKTGLRP